MQKPAYLKQGDTVIIISTARKVSKEEMEPAKSLMETWGLNVIYGEHLFEEDHQFAGTQQDRIDGLQVALDDASIKAVICARGGYGTVQLIDHINFDLFAQNPKWIVGYSDVTVLHNHINQNLNIETLHATMPINFPMDGTNDASTESLRKALFGENLVYEFEHEEGSILPEKPISAPLVGGNLSILYSLTGTSSQLDVKNKFLFMEDLDEYLYHIDRMMMNLKRASLFEACKGVLVGGMSDMNDNTIPYGRTAKEIIVENLRPLAIPVIFGVPAGHIEQNLSLIMGRELQISCSEDFIKMQFLD